MELITYLWQYLVEVFGLAIAYTFAAIFLFLVLRQFHSKKITAALVLIFVGVSIAFYIPNGVPNELAYPLSLQAFGPGEKPDLPVKNVVSFFTHFNDFERVENIARDPNDVPETVVYGEDGIVEVSLTTKEVIAEMADLAFDDDRPRLGPQRLGVERRIFLVGPELVVVVVGRDLLPGVRLLGGDAELAGLDVLKLTAMRRRLGRRQRRIRGPEHAGPGRCASCQAGRANELAPVPIQLLVRDFRAADIRRALNQHGDIVSRPPEAGVCRLGFV